MNYKLYHPQAIHELGRRQNQEDAIYPLPGVRRHGRTGQG